MIMKKTVAVLGSGGRQSAICWKLLQSDNVSRIFFIPGSIINDSRVELVNIDLNDVEKLIGFCLDETVDYVVTAGGDMLQSGIVDEFEKNNIAIFGPNKEAAMLESSKAVGKDFMKRHGIPAPTYEVFNDYQKAEKYLKSLDDKLPIVIKSDGLVNGRGVTVCGNKKESLLALKNTMKGELLKSVSSSVVIEEFIEGPEVSVHVLCDGDNYKIFPLAQDHKPLLEGNKGPNTGGMGTYTPTTWVPEDIIVQIKDRIIVPTIQGLKKDGIRFKGCLFPGVMLTKNGPMLLEYNTRFGSPETQSFMLLMKSDLDELLSSVIDGTLDSYELLWNDGYAATVELASDKYPEGHDVGTIININFTRLGDVQLFHTGTSMTSEGKLVTAGGKILGISATSGTLKETLEKIYGAVDSINFKGKTYRRDIGSLNNTIPTEQPI